jgi:hypothetical protein
MAIFVFTNALVLVNNIDLSDHCSKATCVDDRNEVDVTAMGSGYEQATKGLGKASISLDFFQDFAAGKVHQTLQPLIASSTPIAVEVRPVNAARSTTNPAFLLASALMFTYSGLDGKVGDAAGITADFKNSPGGTGMTYPTA